MWSKKTDNLLADFSMELARDGAWRFAEQIALLQDNEWSNAIVLRDDKVFRKASIITTHRRLTRLMLQIIRLSERGSVANKITIMQHTEVELPA